MRAHDINGFERTLFDAWWAATRCCLCAHPETQVPPVTETGNFCLLLATDRQDSKRRLIARVRGRLMRSAACHPRDPLRGLERSYQPLIAHVLWHPSAPRYLLAWLQHDQHPGLRRRVRCICNLSGRTDRLAGMARRVPRSRALTHAWVCIPN